MEEGMKIKIIENTVNTFLMIGISLPKTSVDLMEIFKCCGEKQDIIQWFQDGKIKWDKYFIDHISNDEYQKRMNKTIIRYLTKS